MCSWRKAKSQLCSASGRDHEEQTRGAVGWVGAGKAGGQRHAVTPQRVQLHTPRLTPVGATPTPPSAQRHTCTHTRHCLCAMCSLCSLTHTHTCTHTRRAFVSFFNTCTHTRTHTPTHLHASEGHHCGAHQEAQYRDLVHGRQRAQVPEGQRWQEGGREGCRNQPKLNQTQNKRCKRARGGERGAVHARRSERITSLKCGPGRACRTEAAGRRER